MEFVKVWATVFYEDYQETVTFEFTLSKYDRPQHMLARYCGQFYGEVIAAGFTITVE